MYKTDHWAVLSALASKLPKRPTFRTKQVAEEAFGKAKDADRRTRNAYRKLRDLGHIEISERGEYQITAEGAASYKKLSASGFVPEKARKRSAPAKAEKIEKVKKTAAAKPKKAVSAKGSEKAPKAAKAPKVAKAEKVEKSVTKVKAEKAPPKKAAKASGGGSLKSLLRSKPTKDESDDQNPRKEEESTEGPMLTF